MHVVGVEESVLPGGRSASDSRMHHFPRWGAPRRPTDRGRLPRGRSCSSKGKMCIGPAYASWPMMGCARSATNDARLPTRRAASSECMNRDLRPKEAMPTSVVGVTTTPERMSCVRRLRGLDTRGTSSRRLDIVYRKRTTDRTRGCLTPPEFRRVVRHGEAALRRASASAFGETIEGSGDVGSSVPSASGTGTRG